ncbi:MAG: hypothetical protein V8T31_03355 [Lachnospiraceae bacterium]
MWKRYRIVVTHEKNILLCRYSTWHLSNDAPYSRGSGGNGTIESISDPVTVCILDSGCNLPDIQGKNYLDGTQDLTDQEGHGTCVYEILKETAPDADIYMLKCFDSSTSLCQNTQEDW